LEWEGKGDKCQRDRSGVWEDEPAELHARDQQRGACQREEPQRERVAMGRNVIRVSCVGAGASG
jgi:hypothetical protein